MQAGLRGAYGGWSTWGRRCLAVVHCGLLSGKGNESCTATWAAHLAPGGPHEARLVVVLDRVAVGAVMEVAGSEPLEL
eukprot:10106045-Karenia_brevis.AAC.1